MEIQELKFKSRLILVFSFLFTGLFSNAQMFSDKKTESRTFKINEGATIEVVNKYGKIHVINWEKDSVRFDVFLKVTSDNLNRINKTMKTIDFDFVNTGYYISCKTIFKKNYSGFIDEIVNFAESIANGSDEVTININVHVPKDVSLIIDNKYGDVYIGDHSGKFDLTLSNGDLKANELDGESKISLRFADAMIKSIGTGRCSLSYSKFQVTDCQDLHVSSKSSELHIDGIDKLNLDSKRDKIYITELNNCHGVADFSDVWISNLYEELNLNMEYANINIDNIPATFNYINIRSEYTDINLFFERASVYNIDITHIDLDYTFPPEIVDVNEELLDRESGKKRIFGKIGNGTSESKITAYARQCVLSIVHR